MTKCICGSRAKRGAPPLSVIRLQDVALPLFNFGNNPFQFPLSPPGFSALWAEDTQTLCARDPDRLYLEFKPYSASLLTAALRRLWSRNCECAPVVGLWRVTVNFKLTDCNTRGVCGSGDFPNQSQISGAAVGFLVVQSVESGRINSSLQAYVSSDNYASRVALFSQSVADNPGSSIVVTYEQSLLSPGCLASPEQDPPLPPGGEPYPYPVTPPLSQPPDAFLPPDKVKPTIPPPPPPPECCDCC